MLLAQSVPSPGVVEWGTTSIEKGGIIFVLVSLVAALGWMVYRSIRREEQRNLELEKRNQELTNLLFQATGILESSNELVRTITRQRERR